MPNSNATPGAVDGPREDPRQVRSRAIIVDAASAYFLEHGYQGANLELLASEAGISKRTVYNLFATKEELFRFVIRTATARAEKFVFDHAPVEIGRTAVTIELAEFAVAHAHSVLDPRVLAMRRLLVGEADRFPELAAEYYERVPARVMASIADMLGRYSARGLLDIDDADLASEHFAFLVLGATLDRALLQPEVLAGTHDIELRARRGAAAFIRAYSPSSPTRARPERH